MFNFIREKLSNVYQSLTKKLSSLFSRKEITHETLDELEELLLKADAGYQTTQKILSTIKDEMKASSAPLTGEQLYQTLKRVLHEILASVTVQKPLSPVIMVVGVNGSGKTTLLGKLSSELSKENKRILLVAGDTFRAAASNQLAEWAERTNSTIFMGKPEQDPSSLIFDACTEFKEGGYDHILIDTAGRLQTKVNLMRELEKMKKIVNKQLGDTAIDTWVTIDAMLGQNSLEQAKKFNEATDLTGVVLTKCDGTGKGGIMFAIASELTLPVRYITFGEQLADIAPFNQEKYIDDLLSDND